MDREGFSTSQLDSLLPRLTEVTMDMSPGGGITVRRMADVPVEFPVVPQALVGGCAQPASYSGGSKCIGNALPTAVALAPGQWMGSSSVCILGAAAVLAAQCLVQVAVCCSHCWGVQHAA